MHYGDFVDWNIPCFCRSKMSQKIFVEAIQVSLLVISLSFVSVNYAKFQENKIRQILRFSSSIFFLQHILKL